MNETDEDISYRAAETYLWLTRCNRYYAHFGNLWDGIAMAEKLVSFALFCSSAYFNVSGSGFGFAASVVGAVTVALDLIVRVGSHQKKNWSKQAKIVELQNRLLKSSGCVTRELLDDIQAERNAIERGEIVFPCLSAAIHNQIQMERIGRPDYHLSFFERTVGQVLPLKYTVKPISIN